MLLFLKGNSDTDVPALPAGVASPSSDVFSASSSLVFSYRRGSNISLSSEVTHCEGSESESCTIHVLFHD